jgi:hypothetical protein
MLNTFNTQATFDGTVPTKDIPSAGTNYCIVEKFFLQGYPVNVKFNIACLTV